MKKIISIVISLTLIIGMFVGCSSNSDNNASGEGGSEEKKIVIAAIYKAGDQVWFIDEGDAAKEMALSMGADDFIFIDAKMNPDTYLQAVDNVIAQKVDGVITCIPDQTLSQVVVSKLKEANIPVIAADDALQDEDGNKIAPWVGINAEKIGQAVGVWAGEYVIENDLMADDSSAVLLLTMDTVSSCVPRTKGQYEKFIETADGYDEARIYRADYDGTTDKGFNAAAAIFTAHPEIKNWTVMAPNDEGAVGAVRALEQAGLDRESCVVGLGAYLAKDEFKKEYSAMKAAAYFSAQDVGGTSAKELMEFILNGTEIPMNVAVDAKMVTKENYEELMGAAAK